MTKYIKTKDGKFAGSIGEGKDKRPTFAPYLPDYSRYVDAPAMDTTFTVNDDQIAAEAEKLNTDIENTFMSSLGSPDSVASSIRSCEQKAKDCDARGHTQQALVWRKVSSMLATAHEQNWKPETSYLGVHWLHLLTAAAIRKDLTNN